MTSITPTEREAMLKQLLHTALAACGAKKGAAYLLDPKAHQLFVRCQEGFAPEDYIHYKMREDDPAVRQLATAGHPIAVGKKGAEGGLHDYAAEAGGDAMLLLPIVARGVFVGYLDLRGGARAFAEKETSAAAGFAEKVASLAMSIPAIEAILPPAPPGEVPLRPLTTEPTQPADRDEVGLSTAVMKTLKKTGAVGAVDPLPEEPHSAAAPTATTPEPVPAPAAAPAREAKPKEERRRRPLTLPSDLLRDVMPAFFRVLPLDIVTIGLCEEGVLALHHVGIAPASEALGHAITVAVAKALAAEPAPVKGAEIVSEEHLALEPAVVPLEGHVTGTFPLQVPLPRLGSETQTTLVLVGLQVDRLGFGSDGREILGHLAASLKILLLQRLRTLDYRQGYLSLLNQILKPIEKTLPYMKSHSLAVANYAKQIALRIDLDEMMVENVIVAAILHDIGLLDVDFDILRSKGKLSEKDQHEIRKHPIFSREWVEQVMFPYPVAPMVHAHHERWDGKGYPEGLRGEGIPLGARIIGVAEAFDAMTSRHSYKPAIAASVALEELQAHAGTQFDPRIVDAFATVLRRAPAKR